MCWPEPCGAIEVRSPRSGDDQAGGAQSAGRPLDGPHRLIAKDYTLKLLIAAAYDHTARTIMGGPGWADSDHFDIQAITPGEVRPTREEQMAMLRQLPVERFGLKFHLKRKELPVYALEVTKGGPKLRPSTAAADEPAA